MKHSTWMPFYPGDYLRDTMHLSRGDHGSYFLLMLAYWCAGEPLPDDDQTLKTICRCPDHEWARTKGTLSKFFTVQNGTWRHNRIESELKKTDEAYRKRLAQTEAARQARLAAMSVTDIVTESVTLDTTTTTDLRECSKPDSGIPTLTEIKAYASMHGVKPETAESLFNHYEGTNLWLNQHGKLINWKHKLLTWAATDRSKTNANNRTNHKPTRTAPDRNAGTHNANRPADYYSRAVK